MSRPRGGPGPAGPAAARRPPGEADWAWRLIDQVTHVTAVSLLWLVFSLPVVTAGAATAAMDRVYFRRLREGRKEVAAPFLAAFRACWRPASAIWAVTAGAGLLFAFDLGFYVIGRGGRGWALVWATAMGALLAATAVVSAYALALVAVAPDAPAHPRPTLPVRLREAAATALATWPWALLILAATIGLPALLAAGRLWQFTPLLGGLIGYIDCRILHHAWRRSAEAPAAGSTTPPL
ncbi:MAG: DUF624 domain-containing protein [Propionibacteriaceae bacterium]|jgi:hypothetical protein|nr:DUF624 domain-containing protein [Propionibacteriaceae bacterium]